MKRPGTSARGIAAAAVLLATVAANARAQSVLTFEDLCYSGPGCGVSASSVLFAGGPITPSYAGFTWTNFRPLDLNNFPLHRPDPDPAVTGTAGYPLDPAKFGSVLGLGFDDVLVRRPVGSGFGQFQFDDLMMGAGWTDGMRVHITGWLNGAPVFQQGDLRLSATHSTFVNLPDKWVDAITLDPIFTPPRSSDPYGSAAQNSGTPFMTFWFDNVHVAVAPTTVPEPTTLALLGGGLLALGLTTRRRKQRM